MNLHYQFWVDYYEGLQNLNVSSKKKKKKNVGLTDSRWELSREAIPVFNNMQTAAFRVLYPGLLVGLGYEHGTDKVKDAPVISPGMSLDMVTGLPFIPGSEVKGMLRSVFIGSKEYIRSNLGKPDLTYDEIHQLEVDIFGHTHTYDPHYQADKNAEEGQGKDVFFDAFPIQPDSGGHLVGLENITSHLSSEAGYDGLTKINPITLLKVMPGVVFFFRFLLHDSEIKSGEKSILITADEKLRLFKKIIADFGMGAKTNVGFGLLEEYKPPVPVTFLRSTGKISTSTDNNTPSASHNANESQTSTSVPTFSFTEGKDYGGTIIEVKKKQLKMQLKDDQGNNKFAIIKSDGIPADMRENVDNLTKVAAFKIGSKCRVRYLGCKKIDNGNIVPVFNINSLT